MVRMLIVNEAMPMSRSDRRSCSTRSTSQRKLNRRVGRDLAAARAQQHRLAGPDLRQPQLVDRDRRGACRREGSFR